MRKKIVIDNRFASVARKYWGDRYDIVPSLSVSSLSEPVCAHPDMVLVRAGEVYVAAKEAYAYYHSHFPDLPMIQGATRLCGNYPQDIAYNVLISEHTAFANLPYIDPVLKETLLRQNFALVHVNQGYAKCSAAVAGKCIITADPSIKQAGFNNHFSVLEISSEDVLLPGFPYGFIGGASGFFDGVLFFFGDITQHRDFANIKTFLAENEIPWEYIPGYPLTDVGTVIGI